MPGQVVLAETVLEFEYVSAFDAYAHVLDSLPFEFVAGHQYTITWDGIAYTRTAFAFSAADGSLCIAVGNPLAAGESSNGDPFAIVCDTSNSYLYFISTEASDTHTVSILLAEGIVLKDRNGEPVAYYGIETVTFDTTTEGKQQTYTKGVVVEGLEIVPDFSGGDMPITAQDGTLVKSATIKKPESLTPENIRNGEEIGGIPGNFIGDTEEATIPLAMADGDMVIEPSEVGKVLSKVTIQKPETLVPENIAEGVDIGGIEGLFKGCKINSGSFVGNGGNVIVNHGLQVTPDIVFVASHVTISAYPYAIRFVIAISANIADIMGILSKQLGSGYRTVWTSLTSNADITSGEGFVFNTNNDSFTVGYYKDGSWNTANGVNYSWFAVGGLT